MTSELLVGTRKGLFTLRRGEKTWSVVNASFVGDRVPMVLADPRDGTWYAALDHGHFGSKLHRSEDRGQSWTEIAVPAYPEKDAGDEEVGGDKRPVPWSLKLVWELACGGVDEPGTLWCGTIPGGLFRSRDRGDSWQLNRGLWDMPARKEWFGGGADWPGIHSVTVHPDDSRRVLLGVSCGGVWESRDGGETWDNRSSGMFAEYMPPERRQDPNIQDPHRIVRCGSSPDHLWAQHHNGVFRSTDGGATWTQVEVPPSSFGFATAVHPRDPETAWFVPAVSDQKRVPVDGKVVVARTRDGGATFEVLRNGLPQEHAYDLVFRHCLDIEADGKTLAFGSTTGTVWLSENQGDLWRTLTKHFPPVYVVRFAPAFRSEVRAPLDNYPL